MDGMVEMERMEVRPNDGGAPQVLLGAQEYRCTGDAGVGQSDRGTLFSYFESRRIEQTQQPPRYPPGLSLCTASRGSASPQFGFQASLPAPGFRPVRTIPYRFLLNTI